MDPQATWKLLLDEWEECNWLDVSELADALLEWLAKGGFPPTTMGTRRMGADWNRTLAVAVCTFARDRANSILDAPDGIPMDVAFTLSCDTCNNEGPDTYEAAIAEGWTRLRHTPAGTSENFLGYCAVCRKTDA